MTVAQMVGGWIQNNPGAVAHVCDVLLSYSQLQAQRPALLSFIHNDLISRVTAAANDPLLIQTSLSERLANIGILPMFGFPTRVRYLFHERPLAHEWPPEGVVDRDLDIAISQFAPCSETVKDGLIHTAIGVVDYQPQGNVIVEQPNPLRPPVTIGLCRHCHAIDHSPSPAPTCPVCNGAPPNYEHVRLSQPRGFRSSFGFEPSRDFDGVFEWTPRASRPKVGVTPISMFQVANFDVWSGQDTVFVINDHEGSNFDFEKLARGETWATAAAFAKVGVNPPPFIPGGTVDRRALASIKPTDVLVLGIHSWPAGLGAIPLLVEGRAARAALYSLGFLLRRAAAVQLDIHEWELKVGLRVYRDSNNQVAGQVFISDALENGAGYSSYLGEPTQTEALLRFVLGLNSPAFYDPLVAVIDAQGEPAHGTLCRTSCPDCLRDFSNLAYHNILDWRLGLDLARLALDPNALVDFSISYWQGIDTVAIGPYFAAMPGWQHVTFGGLQAGRRGNQVEIITHPLWNTDPNNHPPQLATAYGLAVAAGCKVTLKSIFEVLRRPF